GTSYVGLVVRGDALTRRFHFAGERAAVKWQATQAALDLLRRGVGRRPGGGGVSPGAGGGAPAPRRAPPCGGGPPPPRPGEEPPRRGRSVRGCAPPPGPLR